MRSRLALALPALALLAACGGGGASEAVREEAPASLRDAVAEELGDADERDAEGSDAGEDVSALTDLDDGTCLQEPEEEEFEEVRVVPCEEPHDAEVFLSFSAEPGDDGDYPGLSGLDAQAEDACYGAFEGYVGTEYEESELYASWLYPLEEGWAFGDREVVCYLVTEDGAPTLTGSMQGSNR